MSQFETVIGHDGRRTQILRDGERLRVSLEMRDSVKPVAATAFRPDNFLFDSAGRAVVGRPGFVGGDRSASDAAYAASVIALRDAWRQDLPAGAYPYTASKEGTQCTVNGASGVLVREGDSLVCRPTARADAAQPISISDAQKIRDAAYLAMVDEMRDAWKAPTT